MSGIIFYRTRNAAQRCNQLEHTILSDVLKIPPIPQQLAIDNIKRTGRLLKSLDISFWILRP